MPCSSTEVRDVSDSSLPIENATEEECRNKAPMVKPIDLAPRKCLLCIKKFQRIKYLQKKVRRFQIRLAKYKDNTTAGEFEVITFHNYPYERGHSVEGGLISKYLLRAVLIWGVLFQ